MSPQQRNLTLVALVLAIAASSAFSNVYYQCDVSGDPHYHNWGLGAQARRGWHHYSGLDRNTLIESKVFSMQFRGQVCGGQGHGVDADGTAYGRSERKASADGTHMVTGPTCITDLHLALRLNPGCPDLVTHVFFMDHFGKTLYLNDAIVEFPEQFDVPVSGPFNGENAGTITLRKQDDGVHRGQQHYKFLISLNFDNEPVDFYLGTRSWTTIQLLHDPRAEANDGTEGYMMSASGLCGEVNSPHLHGKGENQVREIADTEDFWSRWVWDHPEIFRDDNLMSSSWHVLPTDDNFIAYDSSLVYSASAACPDRVWHPAPTPSAAAPTPAPTPADTPGRVFNGLSLSVSLSSASTTNAPSTISCADVDGLREARELCSFDALDVSGLESERNVAEMICLADLCGGSTIDVAQSNVLIYNVVAVQELEQQANAKPTMIEQVLDEPLVLAGLAGALVSVCVTMAVAILNYRRVNREHSLALIQAHTNLHTGAAADTML